MGGGLFSAHVLDRRADVSCPQDNNTIYTANGYSWDILCNNNFPGNDLPSQPATNLGDCIDACNSWQQDERYQNGASCIAVVFGAASNNGNQCFLKTQITNVTYDVFKEYVARRTTYNIGDPPVYTSISPSAVATSTLSQATSSSSSDSQSTSSPSSAASSSSGGLSDGAKIGIGVGAGVGAAIILSVLLYIFFTRRRSRDSRNPQILPPSAAEKGEPSELSPVPIQPGKAGLFSRITGSHPSSKSSQSTKVNVSEMGSPYPAASELGSPRQAHELDGMNSRPQELEAGSRIDSTK